MMTETAPTSSENGRCLLCDRPFQARRTGGTPKSSAVQPTATRSTQPLGSGPRNPSRTAVAGGTRRRFKICSVGRAERRCARFAQRRSSPQGSSPRRPVEVSSGLLRLPRLHAPAIADDAARARCPSGRTAAPPPRRRSEPPRAPWYLRCPAALGGYLPLATGFRPSAIRSLNGPSSTLPRFTACGRPRHCRRPKTCTRSEVVGGHSITSSAMASSDGGTSRPIAFATIRLMTRSTQSTARREDRRASPSKVLSTKSLARR